MQFKERNCKQNELLMKKLQFLLTMLLVAMVSLSFVSCEKEQPEEKKKEKTYSELIVGTWNMKTVDIYMTYGQEEQTINATAEELGIEWTFVFTKDGELTWDQGDNMAVGEYTIEDKTIMVEGIELFAISKLTEKELSITQSYTEQGIDFTETYNCVRVAE